MASKIVVALRSCFLTCGGLLPAQATLLVGPGGFAEIRDALAVAAPGDRVQVMPGIYSHFEANVGVDLHAAIPGTVEVAASLAYITPGCIFCHLMEGITSFAPTGGHELHVSGIKFIANQVQVGFWQVQHRVEVTGGRVTFSDCEFEGINGRFANPLLTIDSAAVHLQGCDLHASGALITVHALQATNADVTAVDCYLQPSASSGFSAGGNGLRLSGSRMHGSGLTLRGSFLGAAVQVTASELWISDSEFVAGSACAAAGDLGVAHFDRCVFPPPPANCPVLADNAVLLGVMRPLPPAAGAPFELRFATTPNGLVAVVASYGLGSQVVPGLLAAPSWLALPSAFPAALLVADATGVAAAIWNLPASAVGGGLWLQGVGASVLPLPTSPVAGGVVR